MKYEIKEIDDEKVVVLHCTCGTDFYMSVFDVPYQCPNCSTVYEITIVVRLLPDKKDNFVFMGGKVK